MALVMVPLVLPMVGSPDTPSDNSMPGLGSFIVFAFLAVALYFLLKNMNARLRRMSYRKREREAAAREAADGGSQTPGPVIPDLSPGAQGQQGRKGTAQAGEPPHTESEPSGDGTPGSEPDGRPG